MFELSIFLRDHLVGRSRFGADEVRIGRSADNEVQIDNLALSRYHASIETVGDVHLIKDFGSQSGTFVNGERVVGRRALNDGDRIALGKFSLLFRADKVVAVAPEVRDEAAYAVAGQTIVGRGAVVAEARERPCPWVAFLERFPSGKEKPPVVQLTRDFTFVGSGASNQIVIEKGPDRLAVVVRAWQGFSVLALAKGVKRNQADVEVVSELKNRDELSFGTARWRFLVGRPEAGP